MTNQQTYPPTDPPSAEHPERVTSDPVAVPSPSEARDLNLDRDRADSDREADRETPPAEDVTDRVPEDALDDQGTFEDPALADERADPDDLTAVNPAGDRAEPEFHEPPPQETAFGAATVAGAVAAAAQAGPSRSVDDAGTPSRSVDDAGTPEGDRPGPVSTTDEPVADEPVADEQMADEPMADEPVVDEPVAGGPVVDEPVAGLWGEDAVQGFRDRWRDLQLRFIDDPAAATQEAGGLVDEAVESLTTALRSQRAALATPSTTDTEQLRVAMRQHRDFLDRLLGL